MKIIIVALVSTLVMLTCYHLFWCYMVCLPNGQIVRKFYRHKEAEEYFRDHAKPGWLLYEGPDKIKKKA